MSHNKYPKIDYLTRPLTVSGRELNSTELAMIGRAIIVAVSQGRIIDKEFIKDLISGLILIYTNPENVDFGE